MAILKHSDGKRTTIQAKNIRMIEVVAKVPQPKSALPGP